MLIFAVVILFLRFRIRGKPEFFDRVHVFCVKQTELVLSHSKLLFCTPSIAFLPNKPFDKVLFSENLIAELAQIVDLIVIDTYED